MHVAVDLNRFLQFIGFAFAAVCGLLYLVRNTASKYFVVDSNFDSSASATDYSSTSDQSKMTAVEECSESCAVCGLGTTKQCSGCKMVKYCSEACQRSHWSSGHKTKCKDLQSSYRRNHTRSMSALRMRKSSGSALGGSSKILKLQNKILFSYEEFVELFNWDKPGFAPCGLLNCGNSCFANVVLQCLAYTRPLVAYLLEKGHRRECQRDDWCFFCEFQTHVERASHSIHPFSPINILSRLPNIGGNLGYGKQEDAHEFMRFAIDNMQSACLDEFGGEKAVHPSYQETTFIQHIFGGHLQSQVVCTKCNNVSNQYENMMDLTVEIHGDGGSLEECLDQFTAKEQLHGDNMYKCDGCDAYVTAWKHLAVRRAPNILTIALKRFQTGRYGKLNKRVTFPETLDLSPYMSELEYGNDVYKLYAVIVHLDMLNASFFGHYICYVKDFSGNWYRIDDCKVASVDLDEVLSQGAYMLMYSRICARPSCLLPAETVGKEESKKMKIEGDPPLNEPAECVSTSGCLDSPVNFEQQSSPSSSGIKVNCEEELSSALDAESNTRDGKLESSEQDLTLVEDVELPDSQGISIAPKEVTSPTKDSPPNHANGSLIDEIMTEPDVQNFETTSVSIVENASLGTNPDANEGLFGMSAEESSATENYTFEEVNNRGSACALANTDDEVLAEVNSAKPTSILEHAKFENGAAISEGVQNTSRRLSGESSAAKLKPAFTPGFLDKRPRKKLIEPEDKVPAQFSELVPKSQLNNGTNGATKPHLSFENGGVNEEKPCAVYENGKAFPVSQECQRGDSGDQISSFKGTKTNIINGMLAMPLQDSVRDNKICE